jgi:hypothetical protein
MSDEILEELWRIRREISDETGGTIKGLFAHLKEWEKTTPARLVDRSKLRRVPVSVNPAGKVAENSAPYGNK